MYIYQDSLTGNLISLAWEQVQPVAQEKGVNDSEYVEKLMAVLTRDNHELCARFVVRFNRELEQALNTATVSPIAAQLAVNSLGEETETIRICVAYGTDDVADKVSVYVDAMSRAWSAVVHDTFADFWTQHQELIPVLQKSRLISFQLALESLEVYWHNRNGRTTKVLRGTDYQELVDGDKLVSSILGIQNAMTQIRSVGRFAVAESNVVRLGTIYRHLNQSVENFKTELGNYAPELKEDSVVAYFLPRMMESQLLIDTTKSGEQFYEFFHKKSLDQPRIRKYLNSQAMDRPEVFRPEFHLGDEQLSNRMAGPETASTKSMVTAVTGFFVPGYQGRSFWF